MRSPRLTVSVIGAGRATAQESAWAEEVGRLLAERGAVLVCGGLGGVMEAACRGAPGRGRADGREALLHLAGWRPPRRSNPERRHHLQLACQDTRRVLPGYDRSAANAWTDVAIATGLAEARNVIVAASGDGVIAVGGALGTLSEIAFALKLRRPVVTLGSWHLDPEHLPTHATLFAAQTPSEAVDLLFHQLRT